MKYEKTWIIFILFALLTLSRVLVAHAAEFTVTKTTDTADGACNTDCSLREAIIAANASPGSDTINLSAGTFMLTISGIGEDGGAMGDLDITDDLTINGAGANITVIDAGALDRVFDIQGPALPGIKVQINNVKIQNGSVADSGGGIYIRSTAHLTLTGSSVYSNSSRGGDGGGGIYIQGSASLALDSSSIISNTSANGSGGGITNNNVLVATNSTISGNRALGSGGGLLNNHTSVLNNVTVAKNTANIGGGTMVNLSTSLTLRNTLLAGNTNTAGTLPSDCAGTPTLEGYNLIQETTNCTIVASTGDIIGQDPNLGPLQSNGGSTFTHALPPGSPAVDAGNPATPGSGGAACATADQRGIARPVDGDGDGTPRCDIGAYELLALTYLPLIIK